MEFLIGYWNNPDIGSHFSKNFLFYLINFPLACILIIFLGGFFKKFETKNVYNYALYLSAISFINSLILLVNLKQNCNSIHYQYFPFQATFQLNISPLENNNLLYFGVDYIATSLIILTNLFIYLCILNIRFLEIREKFSVSELINKLFFIQWGLLCAFSSIDLLSFFIFFEVTLIPIFTIILQGGSRERRVRASYLIALYTLFGSIFMLFNIIYLLNKYGTTNYLLLCNDFIDIEDQKILWITFFLAFAAKIPVFPFHIWLPEAHVEAPTIGSVILAALLLKLGVFGLIRFGLCLFPFGQGYFKHFIVILTMCSFFYINLTAIRQIDIKKIVAYSSVVHMNLIVLGILCISVESLDGAVYQMIAHGIVSGALFFGIGMIYERFKSRFLWYYGGIAFLLPIYAIFLFIFILANISFPTTSNFIGEMLLFMGIFKDNFIIGFLATLSMFWGVIYNIWTYNRLCFGNIKINQLVNSSLNKKNFLDTDKIEFYILFLLTFLLFLTGFSSDSILNYISLDTITIYEQNIQSLLGFNYTIHNSYVPQNFLIKMTKQFRLEYYEYFFNYLIKHPELNILNFIPLELLTLDQKFDIFKELYRFLIAHKNLNMIDSKPLHEQYESFVFARPRLKSDLEVFNDLEKGLQNIRIPTQNKISL